MSRRILLLGGTGAMGVYLAACLRERGDEVFITSRRQPPADPDGCIYLVGNAHDRDFLSRVLAEVKPDAVVDFMVYATEEFRTRVSLLVGGPWHYLFLSSYRVFAGEAPLTERSPRLLEACEDVAYLATDEYGLTKARQEDLLFAEPIAPGAGVDGRAKRTVIRPGITFSKARFQFGVLEANTVCWRALHGLPVVMPREMLQRQTTLTWGRDVARMIAGLILNPAAYGESFIAASAEHHTWAEVAEIYAKAIGLRVKPCSLEAYIRLTGAPYQVRYDRMFERVIDNRKMLSVSGLRQSDLAPLAEALPRELAAFREAPRYTDLAPTLQARMDALLGCHSALRHLPKSCWKPYLLARHPLLAACLRRLRWWRKG